MRQNYNPDVLSCLANLSSDEVFTPPAKANAVLDLLPSGIWSNKNAKFLDPVCKSGVFLREIAKRLDVGLEKEIPIKKQRINHILSNQIYGIAITQLTSLLSRRSIYCSKTANGEYSICEAFENTHGNIFFKRVEHTWANDRCTFCGVSHANYERGEEFETHAYQFIHSLDVAEILNMKFDVIVGNPPYHISDAGDNNGASPIYNLFVEQAKKLEPRFITMIIPSRWFAGGKGLDSFRDTMLKDTRISCLIDYPIASDVFPGLKVIGGVCYFLWERDYKGPCRVTTNMNGNVDTMTRPLDQYDTFVRFNKGISILKKVMGGDHCSLSKQVSRQKPFGLRTYIRPSGNGAITLYANKSIGKIEESEIQVGKDMLASWKVFLSMAYGEGGEVRDYPRMIIGKPIVAPPESACTETYLVVGTYDNETECKNLAAYFRTKFLRFLLGLRKNTQHITRDRFAFVPQLPMTKKWTDDALYKYFKLDDDEVRFIESMIRPMEGNNE